MLRVTDPSKRSAPKKKRTSTKRMSISFFKSMEDWEAANCEDTYQIPNPTRRGTFIQATEDMFGIADLCVVTAPTDDIRRFMLVQACGKGEVGEHLRTQAKINATYKLLSIPFLMILVQEWGLRKEGSPHEHWASRIWNVVLIEGKLMTVRVEFASSESGDWYLNRVTEMVPIPEKGQQLPRKAKS